MIKKYLVAIVAVHTEENKPLKNWGDFYSIYNSVPPYSTHTSSLVRIESGLQISDDKFGSSLGNKNGPRARNAIFYSARSPLYPRRLLQQNIHFLAFFEIYKIYIPLHRSDCKILGKKLSRIFGNFHILVV